MTVNPWSEDHIYRMNKMQSEGISHDVIAVSLGRSLKAVNAKLAMLRMPAAKKAIRAEKKKQYATENYPGRKAKGVGFFTPSSAHPGMTILEERNTRLALAPRDLTAAFFGDPLPGYSALEKRT